MTIPLDFNDSEITQIYEFFQSQVLKLLYYWDMHLSNYLLNLISWDDFFASDERL
jgi:hypothetical protein